MPDSANGNGLLEDRRASGLLARRQRALFAAIASAAPLPTVLTEIAQTLDELTDLRSAILTVDDERKALVLQTAPALPADAADALAADSVGPASGAAGRAAYRRAPVFTPNIVVDPLWSPHRDALRAAGLCSVWATPVLSDANEVLAVLALLGASDAVPGEDVQDAIELALTAIKMALRMASVEHTAAEAEALRESFASRASSEGDDASNTPESVPARSDEGYQVLWNTSPDVIITIDEASVITSISPAAERVFGYRPDELVGRNLSVLQPEAMQAAHREGMRRHLDTGERHLNWERTQMLAVNRDGREFPIEVSFSDASYGGKRLWAGFIRDVSARVMHEGQLRESEARYKALAENAFDLVCELGADGRFVYTSPNIQDILGYEPEGLIGKSPWDYIHEQDRERVAQQFRDLVSEEGDPGSADFRFLHADGSWCWIEASANLFQSPQGGVHVVIVARNLTERRELLQALVESEERLRTFIENAPVILFAADRDGVFTLYEGMELKRFGLTPGQHVGRRIADVHSDNPDIIANVERVLSGETFTSVVEIEGVHFNAHHAPVRDDSGEVAGMIGILVDVTEKRSAESLVSAQRHLLEMIAVGSPLEDILAELALAVEAHAPDALCSILLMSSDGLRLQTGAAPSLPTDYSLAIDGLAIGPKVGSCGSAAYLNQEVVVEDIEHDERWTDFKDLALPHGLRACWSTPIVSPNAAVLGTMAIYYHETRGPLEGERELVRVAANLGGIAIERRRSDQSLRSRTAELERMYKRLMRTHGDLEESKQRLEEKSRLLEIALETERDRGRHDQLTGALNHAAITEQLRGIVEMKSTAPHTIAMVDVDGLKVANDTYGHQIGDMVLVKVATVLGRDGASVGRYGGDEFVVVLPGADRQAGEAYREAVLTELAAAGLSDPMTGARVPVVASIGLAIYPDEADTVEDLIRLSDSAMYQSRRQRPSTKGSALARPLGGDRAARMVGELVPLLTSPGALPDKLRLVAHRLSVGAGYDAVNFVLSDNQYAGMASSSFARVPDEFLDRWNNRERSAANLELAALISRTKRALIMDELATDTRLDDAEREFLTSAGLQSALVAPMIWEENLIGILTVASSRTNAFTVRDAEFVSAVATQVTAIVRMSSLLEQLRESTSQLLHAHEGTVLMLASAAEAHDATTGSHLQRVRSISEALARELGYDAEAARALGMAATLHDIGKIRVPDSVLGSAQSLAEAEWVLMKQHTIWGGAFLSGKPGFELAATVARYHHERWDGSGYPDGLSGTAIPEGALITTVADSLDAMTSNRPYRHGRPIAEAVEEIVRCSSTQFSPRVVEALVRLYDRGDLAFVEAQVLEGEPDAAHDDQAA